MIMKSSHPWAGFLYARAVVIRYLREEEGKTDKEIAEMLSMDEMQVLLIRMTEIEGVN